MLGGGDALDAEGEGGEAAGELEFALLVFDGGFGAVEDDVELGDDFVARPIEVLEVLEPLEVGDDDAAGVAEDVGDDFEVVALVEDDVGLVGGGAVGGLGEDAAAELGGVGGGDDALDGGGDEDGAGELETGRRRGPGGC